MVAAEGIQYRRAAVPDRIVAGKVVVARPDGDAATVLGGAAAAVWVELDRWRTTAQLLEQLVEAHPELRDVDAPEEAVTEALRVLAEEGLLERRHP